MNDADRLGRDPAMRWVVGGRAVAKQAASTSQMVHFETEFLAADENLAALVNLSGQWIDLVHAQHPPKAIVLDMDSSVSPTQFIWGMSAEFCERGIPWRSTNRSFPAVTRRLAPSARRTARISTRWD